MCEHTCMLTYTYTFKHIYIQTNIRAYTYRVRSIKLNAYVHFVKFTHAHAYV